MQQDVHSWLSALNKTVNRLIHLNPVTGFTINSVGFDIRPKKTSVLLVALPKKVGKGEFIYFCKLFFSVLSYFSELYAIKC